jgi:hypothetical protein
VWCEANFDDRKSVVLTVEPILTTAKKVWSSLLIIVPLFQLCCELKSNEVSQTFKRVVSRKENIQTHGGQSQASAEGEVFFNSARSV